MSAAHPLDLLSAYLDGELSSEARAQVDTHLGGCAACGARLAELAAVDTLAREAAVEAPDGYFEALPARIRARIAPRRRTVMPGWAMLAAASLLLAVVTPLALQQMMRARAPASVAAPAARDEALREQVQAPAAESAPLRGAETVPPATVAAAPPPRPTARPYADRDKSLAAETLAKRELAETRRGADAARPAAPGVARNEGDFAAPPPAPAVAAGGRYREEEDKKKDGDREALARDARQDAAHPPAVAEAPAAPEVATKPRAPEAYDATAAKSAAKPQAKSGLTATGDAQGHALAQEVPRTAAEARTLRERWRRLAESEPGPAGDEARVRVIELGAQAYRLGQDPSDLERLRVDARAYLEAGGPQAERARRATKGLPSP